MSDDNSSTFSKDIANIVSVGLLNDFTDFLKRKTRNSEVAERIRQSFGYEEIHEQTKDLIAKAVAKSRLKYPVEKSDLNSVLKDEKNRKLIYELILNQQKRDQQKEIINQFEYKKYITHKVEQERFKNFLKLFFKELENQKTKIFSTESQEILSEISKIQVGIENLENKVDQVGESVNQVKELVNHSDINKFLDHKIESLEELKDSNKLLEVREKAKHFLDDIKNIDKSKWETIAKTNLIIAQTYLAVEEKQIQEQAIEYIENAISFTEQSQKLNELKALKHLLKNEIEEGLKFVENTLKEESDNKKLRSYRVQLLSLKGEHDEAIKGAKELDDPTLTSRILLRAKEFDRAEKQLEKASKEKDSIDLNDISLYADIIAWKYQELVPSNKQQAYKSLLEDLEKIKTDLGKVDDGLPEQIALIKSKLGLINSWLGNRKISYDLFKEAYTILSENKTILNNLIFSCIHLKKIEEAKKFAEEYLEKYDDQSIRFLKYELEINLNPNSEVIQEIEEILNDNDVSRKTKLEILPVYIKGLLSQFKITKAENYLDDVENEMGDTVPYKKAKTLIYDETGETDKLINLLEETLLIEDSKQSRDQIRRILADVLFNQSGDKSLERATELYEELSVPYVNDINLKRLAYCYYKKEEDKKCLALCDEVVSIHDNDISQFLELRASIYLHNENFVEAEKNLDFLIKEDKNNVEYRIHLIHCLYRQNKIEEANDLLKATRNKLKDGDEKLGLTSRVSYELGKYQDALDDALRSISNDNPSLKSYFFYFTIYLEISISKPNLIKKGDKYYNAAIEAKNALVDSESEEYFLKEITVPKDNIHELENRLLEFLPTYESYEKVIGSYNDFRLPLHYLSQALNKDLITVYEMITEGSLLKLWVNSGIKEDFDKQYLYADEADEIIIDLVSLFTLKKLGLLDKLVESFEKVYVNQRTHDELHASKISMNMFGPRDAMTLYSKDNRLGTERIPKEAIQEFENRINELLNYIINTQNIELIGKSVGRKNKFDEIENTDLLKEVFGAINTEAIEEASFRELALYSDQQRVRDIAGTFGVKTFSISGFLKRLIRQDLIEPSDYHNHLISLLNYNYNFLQINHNTLKVGCQNHGYMKTNRSLAGFDFLKDPSVSIKSILGITTSFLHWVWNISGLTIQMKKKWTLIHFESIVENRKDEEAIWNFFKNPFSFIQIRNNEREPFINTIIKVREKLGI